jgi:hypothetical protein
MSAIPCAQCGHENDLTRVFCQNCGARLERSDTPPALSPTTPVPVKRGKAPSRGLTPLGALGLFARGLLTTAFLAFVMAVIIQVLRMPDNVPALANPDATKAADLFQGVKTFADSPYARVLDLSQDQVNMYLASRLTGSGPTEASAMVTGSRFARAAVALEPGVAKIFVERKFLGAAVFVQADLAVEMTPTGPVTTLSNARIGRLPLPAPLDGIVLDRSVRPVLDALSDGAALLQRANQISLSAGSLRVGWPVKSVPR